MTTTDDDRGAFRDVPYMGVIWVVAEAMKLGFRNGHPDWCNLGQGQPECGPMTGAPPRIERQNLVDGGLGVGGGDRRFDAGRIFTDQA